MDLHGSLVRETVITMSAPNPWSDVTKLFPDILSLAQGFSTFICTPGTFLVPPGTQVPKVEEPCFKASFCE